MVNKILFADNDPDFLKVRKEYLENEGFRVIPACTVTEARRVLERGDIDMAILDLRLENNFDERDISGLILAKNSGVDIPKIMLTEYPSYEAVREALGATLEDLPPAVEFLDKAEGQEALLRAIKRAPGIMNKWFRATQDEITKQLENDYAAARKEARIHFWVTLCVSVIAALAVLGGTLLAAKGEVEIGIFSGVSGIVIEIINALFFSRLDNAQYRVERYHKELIQSKRLELLLSATEEISRAGNKDRVIMEIIRKASRDWILLDDSEEQSRKAIRQKRELADDVRSDIDEADSFCR
jgi:CheY-like chemotaxis protein